MTNRHAQFEKLEHTDFDGNVSQIPVYVTDLEGLTDESKALLHAADIIKSNLDLFGDDIHNVSDAIEEVAQSPADYPNALMIADKDSVGTINIGRQKSEINVRRIGQWAIDTPLLHDMVRSWIEIVDEDARGNSES